MGADSCGYCQLVRDAIGLSRGLRLTIAPAERAECDPGMGVTTALLSRLRGYGNLCCIPRGASNSQYKTEADAMGYKVS